MTVSAVVAMATNGVIGRDGRLPWHLPADLKHFKALTWGHFLLIGRKTFESIGRPLPGRTSVVITRQAEYLVPEGVVVARSLEEALRHCQGQEEVFVIGGAEIYREALAVLDRLYVTLVHANAEGDTRFPPVDWTNWRLVQDERHEADQDSELAYSFQLHVKIRGPARENAARPGSGVVHPSGF
jgi:dihydrofolate reductase